MIVRSRRGNLFNLDTCGGLFVTQSRGDVPNGFYIRILGITDFCVASDVTEKQAFELMGRIFDAAQKGVLAFDPFEEERRDS